MKKMKIMLFYHWFLLIDIYRYLWIFKNIYGYLKKKDIKNRFYKSLKYVVILTDPPTIH